MRGDGADTSGRPISPEPERPPLSPARSNGRGRSAVVGGKAIRRSAARPAREGRRRRGSRCGCVRSRRRSVHPGRPREAAGAIPSRAGRGRCGPRSGPRQASHPTRGPGSRPRRWGARRARAQHRVDLGRVRLALQAQDPPHDVDALRVPAGVDAEAGGAADGGRFPCRGRLGDTLLDVGARRELAGLVSGFSRPEAAGTGQDRDGERLEVAEGAPCGFRETKRASLLLNIGAHRVLPPGRLPARRGTRSPVAGFPLPVRPLPRGAGNARRRRWKPRCLCREALRDLPGTGGLCSPGRRRGHAGGSGSAVGSGQAWTSGEGPGFVARLRDRRNRE